MTNHDESTQDEAVTDSPARPTRGKIAKEAAWTGTMAAVMIWLAARFWEEPTWLDGIGMSVYGVFTGFFLVTVIRLVRRRSALAGPPTWYVDRDGDRWYVRPDGSVSLVLNKRLSPGVWPLELAENEFGPLTPIYNGRHVH